jgi:CRP/FNR family transcriptional regulator, cyclic AMP receptor protein
MSDQDREQEQKLPRKNTVILERRFVPEGSIIMREGEAGENAFLIQSGEVSVYTQSGDHRFELAKMGPGQIVGEMALVFDDEVRTATVEALEDCNLIVITRGTFQKKLDSSDPTIRAIVPMLMRRIINTSNALIKKSADPDEMVETISMIYQNVQAALSPGQKSTFQRDVGPKLEVFLDSIKNFRETHGND